MELKQAGGSVFLHRISGYFLLSLSIMFLLAFLFGLFHVVTELIGPPEKDFKFLLEGTLFNLLFSFNAFYLGCFQLSKYPNINFDENGLTYLRDWKRISLVWYDVVEVKYKKRNPKELILLVDRKKTFFEWIQNLSLLYETGQLKYPILLVSVKSKGLDEFLDYLEKYSEAG